MARAPDEAQARDDLATHFAARGRLDDALVQTEEAARAGAGRSALAAALGRSLSSPAPLAAGARGAAGGPDAGAGRRVVAAELRQLDEAARQDGAAPAIGRLGVLGYSPLGGAVSPLEAVVVAGTRAARVQRQPGGARPRGGAWSPTPASSFRHPRWQLEARIAQHDLHFHFADSDIGKDGPSAGLALWLAGASALLQRPLRARLAATGELTLHGEVRTVGGVHEKLVAARLAGVRTVLLPRRNAAALAQLPPEVAARLEIVLVDSVTEALQHALAPASGPSLG